MLDGKSLVTALPTPKTKTIALLLGSLPLSLIILFLVDRFEAPRSQTSVFLDMEHPENNGKIISYGFSALDHIVIGVTLLSCVAFIVGIILLIRFLLRSHQCI